MADLEFHQVVTALMLRRLEQAGANPVSCVQMACELQRDWARSQTAGTFAEILFAVEGQ
jgi:hypothetical protein